MVPDGQTITTSLVHPRDRGEMPWWRTTVVCDIPGLWDNEGLRRLVPILPDLAEMGFETLLLRPATPKVKDQLSFFPEFIAQAHAAGLHLLVRAFLLPADQVVTGPDSPPLVSLEKNVDLLAERIRAALKAGVDGVDLGTVVVTDDPEPAPWKMQAFSSAVNVALAELAEFDDERILTAALPAEPKENFTQHLTEDWFHHLRSSAMLEVEWESKALREAITHAFTQRDSLGLATPWRHVLQRPDMAPLARGSEDVGWAKGAPLKRYGAMNLFVAALPGSPYLPFLGIGGGTTYPQAQGATTVEVSFNSTPAEQTLVQMMTEALRLRREGGMAASPLAFIDGLTWTGDSAVVMLVGHTMVVLNTSSEAVIVPRKYTLLLASAEAGIVAGGGTSVPPDTCCWFSPAELRPTDPGQYPRN